MTTRIFCAMAYNNAWANHRLLKACAGLNESEFAAPRTGFFPSLKATLNHILIVDWFYVDGLEGGTLGPAAWEDQTPFADPAALMSAQAAVDRRLIRHCREMTDESLGAIVVLNRGNSTQEERRDRLLLNLFQHQIHHRGQAHAMLAGTDEPPPQLDEFFSAGEASLRADDLATLGWTEDEIWGDPPLSPGGESH